MPAPPALRPLYFLGFPPRPHLSLIGIRPSHGGPALPSQLPSAAVIALLASCNAQQSFLVQQNRFSSRHATRLHFRQIRVNVLPPPPPPPPPTPPTVQAQKIFVPPIPNISHASLVGEGRNAAKRSVSTTSTQNRLSDLKRVFVPNLVPSEVTIFCTDVAASSA